jgi:DNA-binding beta-propeller fold protein YncE
MPVRSKSLFIVAAIAIAGPVWAEGLKQVATIPIPGEPINAFGAVFVDQATGLGYLADKNNKALDIVDTRTDTFVARITGFVGTSSSGATSGPNGILAVNDGAELWASDGDSTIKVIDLKTGKIVDTISTGGKKRAAEMAFDPKTRTVIVANPNDEPPFLSLVSTEPGHKILAKIPVDDAAESLERSAYHAPTGMFYTVVPELRADKTRGAIAQTDPKAGKIAKLHEIDHCTPHSLTIVADATMFLGCSAAHAGSTTPGGELAVFDAAAGKVEAYAADLGGSGATANNPKLGQYYHSATNIPGGSALKVIDVKTRKLLQKIPTSTGAHSIAVSFANNHVYLPTTAKDGPCGGCIVVFAPD